MILVAAKADETKTVWRKKIKTIKEKKRACVLIYFPFQVIGYPDTSQGTFSFMPKSIDGMSVNPKYSGTTCYGEDLRKLKKVPAFTLKYLIEFYLKNPDKENFFKQESFFNLLSGNDKLIKQIKQGIPEQEITASWQQDLDTYKHKRKKYLLYP